MAVDERTVEQLNVAFAHVTDRAVKVSYSCSLEHTRLQPGAHTVAAWGTYYYSLEHIRLQPGARTVAAWRTYGCSPGHIGLQHGRSLGHVPCTGERGAGAGGAEAYSL